MYTIFMSSPGTLLKIIPLSKYCMFEYILEYEDDSRLISSLTVQDTQQLTVELLHLDPAVSMSTQGYSCWSAWLDAPAPTPSFSSPSLAQPALRPLPLVPDSSTSTPGLPCWSAYLDAPAPTPSVSSPSLAPPALRPPSTAPPAYMPRLPSLYYLRSRHALDQAAFPFHRLYRHLLCVSETSS